MKKIINISLMLLVCLTLVTGCGKNDSKDKADIKDEINADGTLKEDKNENKGVTKEQVIDGITINNVELKSTTYSSTISIKATNNTNDDITLKSFKLYLKDKDGNNILGDNEFATLSVYDTIKSKESKILSTTVDRNLSSIYSISYELVK